MAEENIDQLLRTLLDVRETLAYQRNLRREVLIRAERPRAEAGAPVKRQLPKTKKSGANVDITQAAGGMSEGLQQVRTELGECERCELYRDRQTIVFGAGDPHAELMFVGEGPGQEEDRQGEPFVGAAGQLLTKMIKAMGRERSQVYIANVVKCRPPNNRDPLPGEVTACEPFLIKQIEAIRPRAIVALGNWAARTLLRTESGITKLRGRFHEYQGIKVMPTFHPAYLLRNPADKRLAWDDLQKVMAELGWEAKR